MKILCISDKKGRVQHNRMKFLSKYFDRHQYTLHSLEEDFTTKGYDLVYYTSFSLLRKKPSKGKNIASITSHKALDSFDLTLDELKKLNGVSVNNTMLYEAFQTHVENLYYTTNGVDTNVFRPKERWKKNRVPILGWVGNRDRQIKNFYKILNPLRKEMQGIRFDVVAPSKKDPLSKLKSKIEMLRFYRNLDFFLVTSGAEGTPNPALEAMACGVPVITTKVGNMVEVVAERSNGFFAEDNVQSFKDTIDKALSMPIREYKKMRRNTLNTIRDWDWDVKSEAWVQFFEDFL